MNDDNIRNDVDMLKRMDKLSQQTGLDLIPTKISSFEPDPTLLLTPEKPHSLLKARNLRKAAVANQSPLDKTVKNKVRFNIPDDELYDESSVSTVETSENSSCREGSSDFRTNSALYAQRNPLADITSGSGQTFESTSSESASASIYSSFSDNLTLTDEWEQSSTSVIRDMKGKPVRLTEQPSDAAPDNISSTNIGVIRSPMMGHRKITPVQIKIDKLTVKKELPPITIDTSLKSPDAHPNSAKPYLRKKSGLLRHEHSSRYVADTEENSNPLEKSKYSSSLAAGQHLQKLQDKKYDAVAAVKKKLESDESLRNLVSTQASAGTNIDPEEVLYKNLVSLDVSSSDVIAATQFRKIKRPPFTKLGPSEEIDIMDLFPRDLVQEKLVLDSKCYSLPELSTVTTPLDSVMSLYEHSLCWGLHNG